MKRLALTCTVLSLMFFVGIASAYYYNLTVPPFSGSASTNNQAKAITNAYGWINSYGVGGNYQVDARFEDLNGSGITGWYRIDDGTYISTPINRSAGSLIHVRFSSDTFTKVHVQVDGDWNPG
ncbi:MAG: hypothetical protein LC121_08290 [Anaerolineae bacterium]|nr:hypothetical protein [Anaerolineae bacterium]